VQVHRDPSTALQQACKFRLEKQQQHQGKVLICREVALVLQAVRIMELS
jgi:hypothetical protein